MVSDGPNYGSCLNINIINEVLQETLEVQAQFFLGTGSGPVPGKFVCISVQTEFDDYKEDDVSYLEGERQVGF